SLHFLPCWCETSYPCAAARELRQVRRPFLLLRCRSSWWAALVEPGLALPDQQPLLERPVPLQPVCRIRRTRVRSAKAPQENIESSNPIVRKIEQRFNRQRASNPKAETRSPKSERRPKSEIDNFRRLWASSSVI